MVVMEYIEALIGVYDRFFNGSLRGDVEYLNKWLGYTWGDHIGEWMDMDGGRMASKYTKVIAPRDHSKSTTLRVKLLHQALFDKWRDKLSPVGFSQQAKI